MRKLVTAALMLAAATTAHAQTYVRIDGAISAPRTSGYNPDTNAGIGGGIGYAFGMFRADFTADYRAYAIGASGVTSRVTAVPVLINGYIDFQHGMFVPYVGIGIGASTNHVRATPLAPGIALDSATQTRFAWAATAGTGVRLARQWTLDVNYRYLDMGRASTGDVRVMGEVIPGYAQSARLTAHEMRAGVRYNF